MALTRMPGDEILLKECLYHRDSMFRFSNAPIGPSF